MVLCNNQPACKDEILEDMGYFDTNLHMYSQWTLHSSMHTHTYAHTYYQILLPIRFRFKNCTTNNIINIINKLKTKVYFC